MLFFLAFLLVMSSTTDIYTTTMDVLPTVLTNDDQEITNSSPYHPTSGIESSTNIMVLGKLAFLTNNLIYHVRFVFFPCNDGDSRLHQDVSFTKSSPSDRG